MSHLFTVISQLMFFNFVHSLLIVYACDSPSVLKKFSVKYTLLGICIRYQNTWRCNAVKH